MRDDDAAAPLELSTDEMRRLGYAVVDELVEHFSTVRDKRVTAKVERSDIEARFATAPPEDGEDASIVLGDAIDHVLAHTMRLDHPRFFAYIPSPNNFISVLADTLVAGFNPFGGTWQAASGPTAIELITIDWFRQMLGLPDEAGGLLLSGGSMANLIGLAAARHARLGDDGIGGAVVYASDQTHSSIDRAMRTLGFAAEQLRKLPTDDGLRLEPSTLARAVAEDRQRGLRPFAVVANAGTTSTGAVDPLREIAAICARETLWLHADGAYGLGAILTDEGRALLDGIDAVDSLSFDPHKWWFQPIETACVVVRDMAVLRDTFSIVPAYLRDTRGAAEEVNLCDYGVQLTRATRSLKLWMSIRSFGLGEFRRAIDHGLELARYAEAQLRESTRWEVTSPAQLAIVSFRHRRADEFRAATGDDAAAGDLHSQLVRDVYREGFAMLSGTVIDDRQVLRLCTINPRTTRDDIDRTIEHLDQLADALLARRTR